MVSTRSSNKSKLLPGLCKKMSSLDLEGYSKRTSTNMNEEDQKMSGEHNWNKTSRNKIDSDPVRKIISRLAAGPSNKNNTKDDPKRTKIKPGHIQYPNQITENGFKIRAKIGDIDDWLVDWDNWSTKKGEIRKILEEKNEEKDSGKYNFGTNVDRVQKGEKSFPRLRIPVKWKDIHGIGHGNKHIATNFVEQLLPKLLESSQNTSSEEKTRGYTAKDFGVFAGAIFQDPPGSAMQDFHEDLNGMDRMAVWNMMVPIDLPSVQGPHMAVAQSNFATHTFSGTDMSEQQSQTDLDAMFWDANWKHRGLGNPSQEVRVQLHLIFGPLILLQPVSKTFKTLKDGNGNCIKLDDTQRVQGFNVNDVVHAQNEIAREYNHGKNIWHKFGTICEREIHEEYLKSDAFETNTKKHMKKENDFILEEYTKAMDDFDNDGFGMHDTEVGYFCSSFFDEIPEGEEAEILKIRETKRQKRDV